MPWAIRTSAVVGALTAGLLAVATVGLAIAPTRAAWVNLVVALLVVPLATGLSWVIARRGVEHVVGVAMGVLSLSVAYVVAYQIGYQVIARQPDPQRYAWFPAVFHEASWWVAVTVGLLLLVFPDGRLPSRSWRWVQPVLVVSGAAEQFYGAFEDGAFWPPLQRLHRPWGQLPLVWDIPSLFAFLLVLGLSLACALSLVLRYRRGDALQRRQIKWLALAGFGVPAYPLLCLLEIWVFGHALWTSGAVAVVSLVGIPLAASVAILRHDLYDIDKALAGAVTWTAVTVVLLGVYVGCSSGVGMLLGRTSALTAALATAVCALALHPVRRAVQRWVDRRLYPLRRAAYDAVDALQRDVSAGRARPEELEVRLQIALRDPGLRVGFRAREHEGYVDATGTALAIPVGTVVELDDVVVGVIVPSSGAASAELLSQVASRASTLVEMIRLRLQVVSALRDAESSRARLLEIGYEERRRLERDLHDGAQQRLVSLGMAMRLAQRHLDDGTVDVDDLLDQSVAELGTAVAELRQIAHGLRPSSLDDGLAAALANLVRSVPLIVDMDIDGGQLPDAVATTAYFVVSEALANAIKHADATRIVLRIGRHEGRVEVVVSDDGCGGARLRTGSAMADRVAALGGSLEVASPPGRGTVVRAELPCAS